MTLAGLKTRRNKLAVRALRSAALALGLGTASLVASAQNLVVSEGGQAIYSYPIAVPPGVGGMEPKLSLVYAGGSLNGPLGVGWSLQGLSIISRCPTIEPAVQFGGTPRLNAVRHTGADSLCLDGHRLIRVSSSAGNYVGTALARDQQNDAATGRADQTEFRTETDGFSRIFSSGGTAISGPRTFTVQTKSGLTQVYGVVQGASTDDENGIVWRSGTDATPVATTWLLRSVTDTVGNTIEFEYINDRVTWGTGPNAVPLAGSEWLLKSAKYGCNYRAQPSCTARHQVEFVYEDRLDKSEAYHASGKVVSSKLLRRVDVATAAAQLVRSYRLSYVTSPSTDRQLLSGIQECAVASGGKCLPATTVNYTNQQPFAAASGFNLASKPLRGSGHGVVTGDFNGDGKTDLLLWHASAGTEITETQCEDWGEAGYWCSVVSTGRFYENELWLADGAVAGQFNRAAGFGPLARVKLAGAIPGAAEDSGIEIEIADVNGDGRSDLVSHCKSPVAAHCSAAMKLRIWLSLSDVDPSEATYGQFHQLTNPGSTIEGPRSSRVSAVTYECGVRPTRSIVATTWEDAFWQDFDGDGRLDLVSFEYTTVVNNNSCTYISESSIPRANRFRYYRGDGAGQFQLVQTQPMNAPLRVHRPANGFVPVAVFDVEGDGRPDILGMQTRWLQQEQGNFLEVQASIDPNPDGSPQMLAVEANGDGKLDLLLFDPSIDSCRGDDCFVSAENPRRARLFINSGAGFFRDDRPLTWLKTLTLNTCPVPPRDCDPGTEYFEFGAYWRKGSTPLDLNGDGLSDFLAWRPHYAMVYLAKAGSDSGKSDASVFGVSAVDRVAQYALPEVSAQAVSFLVGDFVGTGGASILRTREGTNTLFVRTAPPADLLASIKNVSGAVTEVKYASLAGASSGASVHGTGQSVYTSSRPPVGPDTVAAHTWPVVHAQPATWVVSETKQTSATPAIDPAVDPQVQNWVVTAFAYYGLKVDAAYGGSLGFESVTKYSPRGNGGMSASTTEYFQPATTATSSGADRKGYLGRPKCVFVRYDPSWAPNSANAMLTSDRLYVRPRTPPRASAQSASPQGAANPASRNGDCFDADSKPGAWADQIISMTVYSYCDLQSASGASAATPSDPCGTSSMLKRPYQYRSVDRNWDLNDRTRLVTKVETTNSLMTSFGDVRESVTTTTGYSVGGYATPQTYTKANSNTYFDSEDAPGERFVSATKWMPGRLRTSRVTSSVPTAAPTQDVSLLSATARATQDPALSGTPPRLVGPEVLMPILQLLLGD